jgi:hypothetical protein
MVIKICLKRMDRGSSTRAPLLVSKIQVKVVAETQKTDKNGVNFVIFRFRFGFEPIFESDLATTKRRVEVASELPYSVPLSQNS